MNNIQSVSDALLCSNCGACKAICPVNAIAFQTSSMGRMYAVVNNNCIECKACTKICPSLDHFNLHKTFKDKYIGNILNVYSGKSTNKKIFRNSQSGGACTAIVSYLFERKLIDAAIVCRMYSGNPPVIKSIVINNSNELSACQKSCYTPVDLLSALQNTGEKESIALVGLPCHIQGAVNLMKQSRKFRNISYKLGLICDRTLGLTLQDVMMSYLPNPTEVTIAWRKKDFHNNGVYYSYKQAPVALESKDRQYVLPNTYRFLLKDYFTLPRCRVCYDKLNTFADIVLGDPWGMSDIDWQKGESVIITRTSKGEELIKQMHDSNELELKKKDVAEVINGQHISERKVSVTAYSKGMEGLHQTCKSYLYKQKDAHIEKKDIQNSQKDVSTFIMKEQLTKLEITTKARTIIQKYERCQKWRTTFLFKTLSRIKRIIKH